MASLTGITLDPQVEEASGGFEVLPEGTYKMVITNDNLHDNKKNNGKILTVHLQVVDGHHAGVTIKDHINIINPSLKNGVKVCQQIGQGTLKKICNLCGVQYPPADTTGLYGKPMSIKVGVQSFTSNNTGNELKSNTVKSYGAVQAKAPSAPAQVNLEAGGDAPW